MYIEELERDATPEEIVLGLVFAVVAVTVVYNFLTWATE
jgi:hypothetical protein